MIQECKFDKNRDISEVDQFGFVDLVDSVAAGAVPSDLQSDGNSFDGTDIDPESIIGKPSDAFEAIRMQEELAEGVIKSNKKSVKNQQSDSANNE